MHEINTEISRGLSRRRTISECCSSARLNEENTGDVHVTFPNITRRFNNTGIDIKNSNNTAIIARRKSLLQQFRNRVFSNKLKTGDHLDLNDNSRVMKQTNTRKWSSKLHNGILKTKQTKGLSEDRQSDGHTHKYSTVSFICENETSPNCNGITFGGHPSLDTVSIEIPDLSLDMGEIIGDNHGVTTESTHF